MDIRDKREFIAQAFRRRLQAPDFRDQDGHPVRPAERALEPSQTRVLLRRATVRLAEVRRAFLNLPPRKAPGPDGFPAELYKKLPALLTPLTDPLNLIFRTGRNPNTLRGIYLVPLAKPGKGATTRNREGPPRYWRP